MYKTNIKRLLLALTTFTPVYQATAEFWNLPQQLSPGNSSITFEVDSTWHLIKGTSKNFSGKLWLNDPKDFQSVRGNIILPISEFDTENESRNERMREVTHASEYPNVEFSITNFNAPQCNPTTLTENSPCNSTLEGDLTINNVTKKVIAKTSLEKNDQTYKVTGVTSIKWADFNVEDPSILVAKLYEDVNIQIKITLPPIK